ncbi:MAG TPA: LuxR C-terminal-related transcriptional regulator [Nannocystaceae bacterium]|nr:LuxR C-terminal-related transcriptional regulator [Nannocystaceae bacterium]
MVEASRALLDGGHGVYAFTVAFDPDGTAKVTSSVVETDGVPRALARVAVGAIDASPPSLTRPVRNAPAIASLQALWKGVDESSEIHPARTCAELGFGDLRFVTGFDPSGRGFALGAPLDHRFSVDHRELALWQRLRAHLLAGLRLRWALREEAVLTPTGRAVHAEGDARDARALEALRLHAKRIDRARTSSGRRDPEAALEEWRVLVSGRWSLLDRFESDGRRYLVARRNDPEIRGLRPLSQPERQVLALAALGWSNKEIAYALGVAASTVSSHLRAAMRRLGVTDRAALAELWAARVRS